MRIAVLTFILFILTPWTYSRDFSSLEAVEVPEDANGPPAEWTLQEALDYAFIHNPKIIIARNKMIKSHINLKEAKRRLNPNISVHYGYRPMSEDQGVGFSISQDLDRLFRGNKNKSRLARIELESSVQELILVGQEVVREVTEDYHNLQTAKKLQTLKEQAYADAQKSLDLAQEKFNLGIISLDELFSKQQAVRRAEFEVQESGQEEERAYLVLCQSIGWTDKRLLLNSKQ